MQKFTFLFSFLILFTIKSIAADFYWVGGSGKWSDISHWATTSGGSVKHTEIPTIFDNVYFDVNSFVTEGDVLDVNLIAPKCLSMDWRGATHNPVIKGLSPLSVYGSLYLISNMTFDYEGTITFEGDGNQTLQTGGNPFLGSLVFNGNACSWDFQDLEIRKNLYLNSTNGSWTLLNDLKVNENIYVNGGTFTSNSHKIKTYKGFYSDNSVVRTLNLGSSTVNVDSWNIKNDNLTINLTSDFLINIQGTTNIMNAGNGITYYDVNFIYGGKLNSSNNNFRKITCDGSTTISGSGSNYETVLFNSSGTFLGNSKFVNLHFTAGFGYVVGDGIPEIDNLHCIGLCDKNIYFTSTSKDNIVDLKLNNNTIFDYTIFRDLNFLGGKILTANNSVNLQNCTNITINQTAPQNLYWVGGSGKWEETEHWSYSSGGLGGACIPTPIDNVFFDENSFTEANQKVEYSGAICRSMDWTGSKFDPTFDGTGMILYGSLTFIREMSFIGSGVTKFEANEHGHTVTSATKFFNGNVVFDDKDGGWTIIDSLNIEYPFGFEFKNGWLNTNDQVITAKEFNSPNGKRTLFFGASHIKLFDNFTMKGGDLLTFDAGTSLISIETDIAKMNAGDSLTYYNVEFVNKNGNEGQLKGTYNKYNKVTFNSHGSIDKSNVYDTLVFSKGKFYELPNAEPQIIKSELISNGNCSQYITIRSTGLGEFYKENGLITINYVSLKNCKASGGAIFTANNAIDEGNNLGWIINNVAARDLYWVGGSGNWNDENHWSITSNGDGGECIPTQIDNVYFDENSFPLPCGKVNIEIEANFQDMDWTGANGTPILGGSGSLRCWGSIYYISEMEMEFSGSYHFNSDIIGNEIRSSGKNMGQIFFQGIGGEWTLLDNLLCSSITHRNGIFNTNSYRIKASSFSVGSSTPKELNLGVSKIELNKSWSLDTRSLVFNGANAEFTMTGINTRFHTLQVIEEVNYKRVEFTSSSGTSNFKSELSDLTGKVNFGYTKFNNNAEILGETHFDTLIFTPNHIYTLESDKTQTIKDYLRIRGNNCFPITLKATEEGTQAIIYKATGDISGDYILMKDMRASGDANFYEGLNSTDFGNNTGWLFQNKPGYAYGLGGDVITEENQTIISCDNFNGTETTQYIWDNGEITDNLSITTPGRYSLKVQYGVDCTIRDTIDIYFAKILNSKCYDANNGSIKIEHDSRFPYTFEWDSGKTTSTISNLSIGDYIVKAINEGGEIVIDTFSITQPDSLYFTNKTISPITCNDNDDAKISCIATGGNPEYQYSIDGFNFQTEDNFENLAEGNYPLFVRDKNGCEKISQVEIINPDIIDIESLTSHSGCFNAADGQIQAEGRGGNPPYKYSINGTDYQAENIFKNLSAGDYSVWVSDANNCPTAQQSVTVENINSSNISIDNVSTNATCGNDNQGNLEITANGGTGSLTYSLDGTNYQSENTFNNLVSDIYNVKVRDENFCEKNANAEVQALAIPSIDLGEDKTICPQTTHTINSIAGFTSYLWQDGSINQNLIANQAGEYWLKVENAEGCFNIDTININLVSATIPNLGDDIFQCSSGAIDLDAGTYASYLWNTGQTTQQISVDKTGEYSVEVTDNGCTLRDTTKVKYIKSRPKYDYNWVFGIRCGLDFNDNNVTSKTYSNFNKFYGSASISSETGELLFYTDGKTVWNKNNEKINITDLNGTSDCSQQALIIPKPETENQYYLFVNEGSGGLNTGLKCYIVDMTLYSGKGGVNHYKDFGTYFSDHLMAVPHSNGTDFWVIAHKSFSKEFKIYKANSSGVNLSKSQEVGSNINYRGNLKASPNGKKLALTNTDNSMLNVYDFDNSTGTIGNRTVWGIEKAYGVEFSPSGTKLYVGNTDSKTGEIHQIDFVNPSMESLVESFPVTMEASGQMLLAPNGKIYIANKYESTLDVIENPNEKKPNCNFVRKGQTISGYAYYGLPNFPKYGSQTRDFSANAVCQGETTDFLLNDASEIISAQWNFGEATNPNNTSTDFNPSHTYESSGTFGVLLNLQHVCENMTVTKTIEVKDAPKVDLGEDIFTFDPSVTLDAGTFANCTYSWESGENSQTINVTTSGEYIVTVLNTVTGCEDKDTINIEIIDKCKIVLNERNRTNLKCFGGNDGAISVETIGAIGNVKYYLNDKDKADTTNYTNLTAGIYEIIAKDQGGCEDTVEIEITQPNEIAATFDYNPITCNGGLTNLKVSASEGTGIYTYSKDGTNYQTSQNFEDLISGDYTIYVKDVNNCVKDFNTNISQPDEIKITKNHKDIITCYGDATGQIELLATGGTGAFEYSITGKPYQSSGIFEDLTFGFYQVNAKDANGCIQTETTQITQPIEIGFSEILVDVTCFGDKSGSITIDESHGGTGFHKYSINGINFQTSPIFDNLVAGDYQITVKDENNCIISKDVNISQPTEIKLSEIHDNVTSCTIDDGSITVTANGGTNIFEYSLNGTDFQTSNLFENLSSGDYTVIVKDEKNCTKTIDIKIESPNPIHLTGTPIDLTCYESNNGQFIANATGGTGNLEYSIDGINWQVSPNFNTLWTGDYQILVKDQAFCIENLSFTISEPDKLKIEETHNNITCFGNNNGSINVSATGGTGTVLYSLDGSSFSNQTIFENLIEGNHNLIARDVNNCEADTIIKIKEPADITQTNTITDVTGCFGNTNGILEVTGTGGNGILEYSINGAVYQANNRFENLASGDYIIKIKDANSCEKQFNFSINQPDDILIDGTTNNVTCFGDNNGEITLSASGGTGILQYSINGIAFQPEIVFSNISEGNYTVTVKDENSCTKTKAFSISQPAEIQATETHGNINCFGENNGSISINATGGTGNFQYSLDNITFNSQSTFENLSPDDYQIFIKDAKGCTKDLNIEITQPEEIVLSETHENVIGCFGHNTASITVSALGGNGNYQYSINGANYQTESIFNNLIAGDYQIKVKDAKNCVETTDITISQPEKLVLQTDVTNVNGCFGDKTGIINLLANGGTGISQYSIDGTNYQPNGIFSNLAANNYKVYTKDENNCMDSSNLSISQPEKLLMNLATENIKCFDDENGKITVSANGGTGVLKYSIDGTNYLNSNIFDNLSKGDYTIYTKDENLCKEDSSVKILEPAEILINKEVENVKCFGDNNGKITVLANGGTGVLQYSLDGTTYQNSNVFNNLSQGDYTIYTKDKNSCTKNIEANISQPDEIEIKYNTISPLCFGGKDGSIDLNVLGGQGGFSYEWSNDSTVEDLQNIAAGIYNIKVKDAADCLAEENITISQPAEIQADIDKTKPSCFGDENGNLSVTANGGTGSHTFVWANGENTSALNNLKAGSYNLQISDENKCTKDTAIELSQPEKLTFGKEQITHATNQESQDGEVLLNIEGGTSPYSVFLDENEVNNPISFLTAGIYNIKISDLNGCIAIDTVEIKQNDIFLEIPNAFTPNGDNVNDVWEIRGIEFYPQAEVEIYDRDGRLLFKSKSYTTPWNGTYKGKFVKADAYFYIVKIDNKTHKGTITVLR